jgi:hypothetical protein
MTTGVRKLIINRNIYDDHVDPHTITKIVEIKNEKTSEIKIGFEV